MKATLILSLLLLLTLVRSQTLFEEKFLLGSHKKDKEGNKKHRSDTNPIFNEEKPIMSENKKYLAKLIQGGDLALYEIKEEGESRQNLLWSTELKEDNKGFKRNLYRTEKGVLVLRKPNSTKNLWTSKCKIEEKSDYNITVTDDGKLCLIGDGEEVWCHNYEEEDCE